jgi:DNA-binding CsgD family transcriptional regulator
MVRILLSPVIYLKKMAHFIFIFIIVSTAVGIGVIIVSILLYRKESSKTLGYFIGLLLALTLLVLSDLTPAYSRISLANTERITYILCLLFHISGEVLLIFILPVLTHCIISKPISPRRNVLYKGIGILYAGSSFLRFIPRYQTLNDIRFFLLYLAFYWALGMVIANHKEIKIKELRSAVRSLLATTTVFFPFMIIQQFREYIPFLSTGKLPAPFAFILCYFSWNIIIIYYASKYFFSPVSRASFTISEIFIQQYNITNREREIINLIVKGCSNTEIGKKLFISPKTVRNHVYNIYQKIGVNNRFAFVSHLR